jgi:RimJ/RimL family protein N-acetyltransferase
MWQGLAARLEGRLVVLEPLEPEHESGLFEAARESDWRWMPADPSTDRGRFQEWFHEALARAQAGVEVPFATLDAATGLPVGSTRFLTLRPEHRGLEIGFTWLRRSAWESGANVEAKLLQLEHAFERNGCMRVEFKTDARNRRSRRALEALPGRFEGIFRKHMLVRGDTVRDSAYYAVTDDEWPAVRANLERRLASRLAPGP